MGANCTVTVNEPGGKVVISSLPSNALPREEQTLSRCSAVSACSNVSVSTEKDSKGMTNHHLLCAARDNDIGGVRRALADGAYLETRRPFVMRPKPAVFSFEASNQKKSKQREGLTPLMYAAQNGSTEAVRLLLEARAHVSAKDEDGLQPLHFAAAAGALEVCSMLIASRARVDHVDEEGKAPLDHVPAASLNTKAERQSWEVLLRPQKTTSSADGTSASKPSSLAVMKAEAAKAPTSGSEVRTCSQNEDASAPPCAAKIEDNLIDMNTVDLPPQSEGCLKTSSNSMEEDSSQAVQASTNEAVGPPPHVDLIDLEVPAITITCGGYAAETNLPAKESLPEQQGAAAVRSHASSVTETDKNVENSAAADLLLSGTSLNASSILSASITDDRQPCMELGPQVRDKAAISLDQPTVPFSMDTPAVVACP